MTGTFHHTNETDSFGRQEIAADTRVGFIEFLTFDIRMSQLFGLLVPWHSAIEFLRLHPEATPQKVWWKDKTGRIGHSGWSWIKVVQNDDRLFQLHTEGGHPILIEVALEFADGAGKPRQSA